MRVLARSVLILLLASPAELFGQQVPDSILRALEPESFLRLHLADGSRVDTQLAAVASDGTTLQMAGRAAPITVASIDSLWLKGNATSTGILVGASVGGAAGFLVGGVLAAGEERTETGNDITLAVGGAVIGMGLGALAGAAFGSGIPTWTLLHARMTMTAESPAAVAGATVRLALW